MTEVMVCHFDGPKPYNKTNTGNATGHLGQMATANGGVIYRPCKYGKGVQIAGQATNLITNPEFAIDAVGWNSLSSYSTVSNSSGDSVIVGGCLKIESIVDNAPFLQGACPSIAIPDPTATYTWSVCYKASNACNNVQLFVHWKGGSNPGYTSNLVDFSLDSIGQWCRISAQFTPDYADRTQVNVYIQFDLTPGTTIGASAYIDAASLTQADYATPYLSGAMGAGHSWSGTAHNSTSVRDAATLTYNNPLNSSTGGVIMGWIPAAGSSTQPTSYLFDGEGLSAYFSNIDQKIYFTDGTNAIATPALTFDAEEHQYLAFGYSNGGLVIWRNGEQVASGGSYQQPTLGNTFWLGSDSAGANQANGWFDELIITDHLPTINQIRAYYYGGVLRIVGENESINLLDPDNFHLAMNGWKPALAVENDIDYDDVREQLKLLCLNKSDDDRATNIHRLNRLLQHASKSEKKETPVYIEARSHGESEIRYAVLRGGGVPEIDAYGLATPTELTLNLIREGAWRAVVPRTYGLPWQIGTATTIYNKEDSDGNCEIDLTASEIPGDASALTVMKLDTEIGALLNYTGNYFVVAQRTGAQADYAEFTPHFNAVDLTYIPPSGATLVADSDAPGDQALQLSGAGYFTMYWTIPAANMPHFRGMYMVYAAVESNYAATLPTIQFQNTNSQTGDTQTIPFLVLPHKGAARVYLGAFSICPDDYPTQLTMRDDARLTLNITSTDPNTIVTLHSLILVPISQPVFKFGPNQISEMDVMVADGVWERCYQTDAATNEIIATTRPLSPQGTYVRLSPNQDARLFVFRYQTVSNQPVVWGEQTATATIFCVPRYLSLRGDF